MQLRFSGSDFAQLPPAMSVAVDSRNTITTAEGSRARMTLSTATGLFRGIFAAPGERSTRPFRGAIIQSQRRGAGFFHRPSTSVSVFFEERPQGSGGTSGTIIVH